MTTGSSAPLDDQWPTDAPSRIEAAAAALELCALDDFESVLVTSLADVAGLFGIVAMGECTERLADGVAWFDPSATDDDEVTAVVTATLDGAAIADGPFSVRSASGRPAIGVPNPPGSHARAFVVLAGDPTGFSAEQTALLSLFAATVSSARRRVVATRQLEDRLANQEFLNDISALAANDAPDTLHLIAVAAADHYGVGAVSMWRFEQLEARLSISSNARDEDALGDLTVPFAIEQIDQLSRDGFGVTSVGEFTGSRPFRSDAAANILVVPMIGRNGIEGVVAFTESDARSWTDLDVAGAQSIARSMQKVIDRHGATDAVTASADAERMLRSIASDAGAASHTAEADVLERALLRVIEHFDLASATLWRLTDTGDAYRLVAGCRGSGESTGGHPEVPIDFDVDELDAQGYTIADHDPTDLHPDDPATSDLIVALNTQSPRHAVLTLSAEGDRRWAATEINACRTLASVLDQALARFAAERRNHRQLQLEGLARRIAGWAVDARTDTVDAVLRLIVLELTTFFGLAEAQIWRIADGHADLRSAHRPDGHELREPVTVPFDPGAGFERRGWAVVDLGDVLDLWDGEARDPLDSRLLITTYGDADVTLGMLILVDPSRRTWDDDELTAIRSIADTVAQLRTRLEISHALEWQHAGRDLLNEIATEFVNATFDAGDDVIGPALGRMRAYLECHSVAVFALDHDTLDLHCIAESSVDGEPLQALHSPMRRDDPMMARILDPAAGPLWTYGELAGMPDDPAPAKLLLYPSVRGRDVVVVGAVMEHGAAFREGTQAAMQGLTGLIAQLRSRMWLERSSHLRSEADRMLGEIAADFVERSIEDVNEGVYVALSRFATLFGLTTATLWRGDDLTSLAPVTVFRNPGHETPDRDPEPLAEDSDIARTLAADPYQVLIFEPGAAAPDPSVAQHTVMFAPVVDDGVVIGALSSTDVRAMELVADLEIQRDFMEAAASLIRQLWRRLEADAEIGRKLASEDLLRQFATRLVTGEPEADGADALGWLAQRFGIDHASMWRVQVDDGNVSAEPRVVYGAAEHLRLREGFEGLKFVAAADATPDTFAAGVEWPIGVDRPATNELRELFELDGPRRGGFVAERDGSYLFFTRPGEAPIPEHVLATMGTALSILSRHAAKSVAERAFASAFNTAPIAICMRDRDTNLISCNPAYADLTGRSEVELAGTPLSLVVSPDQADEVYAETTAVALGAEIQSETAYRRPDGSIVWARVRTTSVEVPGRTDPVFFTYSEDITESRRARQLLEYQATHDELTGLPNRRAFVGAVADELTYGRDCAVLILDLDRFKLVNDSLGHSAGDMLLITCADRIRLSVRPGDTVCRLGGDEFAILLRSPADNGAATAVADRLLRLLAEPVRIGEEEVFPSASIGIAIPDGDDAVEDLLRHADAAMYQAKAQGRDRSVRFDRSMRDAVVERIRTETEFRRAIENDQLEVHYQPEFVLDSGQIVGAEALIRWHHPERGLLSAGAFIGLAEETGLVVDVGRWVLGQATMQAARWVREGHDIIIRVNLSARQLRGAVVGEVQQALATAALAPERLCLELTETAIMDDVQESARILQEFRDLGVQVAIDDFGTGFSSLAYLKRFPVDILKIDRTFVDGVGVDPDDTAIVRSVIGLARTLRLEVVAEGIEDPAQIAELVRLGCNRGQGFHLARPAPPADIGLLLATTPD